MRRAPKQPWSLWITFMPFWVIANSVGFGLVVAIDLMPLRFWRWLPALSIGVILSLLQWVVLEKYIGADYVWIGASSPVYGVFLFISYVYGASSLSFTFLACLGCLGLLGLLQRAALNSYLDGASSWPIASPVAGIIGFTIPWFLRTFAAEISPAVFWGTFGTIYGLITGMVLIWLKNDTGSAPSAYPPWKAG